MASTGMPNVYPAMALAPQTAAYIANDSPLSWYYKGRQERQENEQRNLLKEAGGLAAQGNTQGATSALFRGGDINSATNLANWDTGRRTQALKLLLDGARRADTPERWGALVNSVERTFGPDMVAQYRDFNARPAAMTALEQAQLQLHQLELQQKQQLYPLQLLQTQNAVATAVQDREMQRSLMGAALGGQAPAAAPPPAGQPPLGPVTPRTIQTLPLNDDTGAAVMPHGAPPPQALPQTPAPALQQAPVNQTRTPIPAGPIIPQSVPQQQPAIAPPVGPQVRGWEGGEQPDFVGTPLAHGQVSQPVPTAPAPAPTPAATQGGANFGAIFANMSPERRLAAAALIAKKDWSGFSKLLNEVPPEQKAAQQARGKALGEAQANLPQAMQTGVDMVRNIDAVIDDPYLGWVTGMQSSYLNPLAYLPATPYARDTMSRIDQVRGQAFLQAFQSLKGGGQITEKEGQKAEQAVSRLNALDQTDKGYLEALNDARFQVWDLMNLARRKAGQAPIPYVPHKTDTKRLARVANDADWEKLSPGMPYIDPEGNVKVKR